MTAFLIIFIILILLGADGDMFVALLLIGFLYLMISGK